MTRLIALAALLVLAAAGRAGEPPAAEAVEFFEKRVRPVLVEHCVRCHGEKKQQSGLRLDSRAAALKGGDRGPALVPGDPDKSALVLAVRHDGELRMPPKDTLPARAVEDLAAWVKMGAPWPDAGAQQSGPPSAVSARATHWAFRPVGDPAVPAVKNTSWPLTPVDHFVLARLEREGLRPSPEADRRTLIRRLTFDLHGLPPTPDEVEAFAADPAPDAYERLIDRLLASPRYGERWGRHWLDVARYADTKGYIYDDREQRRYPFAYTYRDYVIRAFNEDKPFDRFVVEQIAADQLPPGGDNRSLAALGFLTLGRRFMNNTHDVIDDRIDVVTRGLMGLTVTCARCHDHKFDPVPTTDYYALYGVFAACTERTVRLDPAPAANSWLAGYERQLRAREAALRAKLEERRAQLADRVRDRSVEYLTAVLDAEKLPGDEFYVILSADDVNPVLVRRWQAYLLGTRRDFDPVFAAWTAFAAIPDREFAARSAEVTRSLVADRRLNRRVALAFAWRPPSSRRDVAERYGRLLRAAHRSWREAMVTAALTWSAPPTALDDPAQEELRRVLYAADGPAVVPPIRINEIEAYFDEPTRVELGKLQMRVDELHLGHPAAPPSAHALTDAAVRRSQHVFVRGNPKRKGEEVPRRFLTLLSDGTPFADGSGRLELARAIASPDNPLTARVFANRVWAHHLGRGLVSTPSDFGLRADPPTHPELLDWLAKRFMEDGWSVKRLHRLVLLSATYRQSSAAPGPADPDNRLLGRANRRRLDFEALRDSLLFVSGRLDLRMGGRPADLTAPTYSPRRAVYGFIDRFDLPALFRTFDFANPDLHSPQRPQTTVPQQALFLMNDPFLLARAEDVLARAEVAAAAPAERIDRLYRLLYQRPPTADQLRMGKRFLAAAPTGEPAEAVWRRYVQALLMANEFAFVD